MPPTQRIAKQNRDRAQLEKISQAKVKKVYLNLKNLVNKHQKSLLNAAKPYFSAMAKEVYDWNDETSKIILKQAYDEFLSMNLLGNKSIPNYTQPKGIAKRTAFEFDTEDTEKNKSKCNLTAFSKVLEDTIKSKRYSQIPELIDFWDKNLEKSNMGAEGYEKDEEIALLKKLKTDALKFQMFIRNLKDEKEISKVETAIGKENFAESTNGNEYVQRIAAGIISRIKDLN